MAHTILILHEFSTDRIAGTRNLKIRPVFIGYRSDVVANIIRPSALRLHDLTRAIIFWHELQIALFSRESKHPRETMAGIWRLHGVSTKHASNFAMGIWSV